MNADFGRLGGTSVASRGYGDWAMREPIAVSSAHGHLRVLGDDSSCPDASSANGAERCFIVGLQSNGVANSPVVAPRALIRASVRLGRAVQQLLQATVRISALGPSLYLAMSLAIAYRMSPRSELVVCLKQCPTSLCRHASQGCASRPEASGLYTALIVLGAL